MNEKAAGWAARHGAAATHGTFADAAAFGEIVVNATSGIVSLDALRAAGAQNLDGKVLVDVANPLDFSRGMPPTLSVCNTESLAGQIQAAFPSAKVVKTPSTMNAQIIGEPAAAGRKLYQSPSICCGAVERPSHYASRMFSFIRMPMKMPMKPASVIVLLSMLIAACGAPATVASVTPTPTPVAIGPAPVSTDVPATKLDEAPKNWQLLDDSVDHVPGISSERAMRELLAGKSPKRTVVVAIIDNGIDTTHVDLRANLWTNPKETPSNKKDDDNNGFVDDMHGWNFIGSANGDDVHFDTFEVTREYARCHGKPAASGAPPITDAERCKEIDASYDKQRSTVQKNVENYRQVADVYHQIVPMLAQAARTSADSLSADRVRAVSQSSPQVTRARQVFLELASQGASPSVIDDGLKSLEGQLKYGLNPDYDTRTIVGDHYSDPAEHRYGNPDVMGQDPKHGTHVAGIIGAVRGNGVGVDGIAPAVKFMMIRTVPDGDERDKDVANAIRYATDNGAQIISMSFGKPYSPYKSAVDDAVKYADAHGVLMVHAAGNDGADLSKGKNFPTPAFIGGGHAMNWLEVGASSWKGGADLAAGFSNYGKNEVDVFAPGVDILSTVPGNEYERDSGTSMAAPVVSGLAALIMGYYPNLSAADVKKIITASVSRHSDQMVTKPGSDDKVPFGSLSITGGIVNAYRAIKMAEQMSAGKAQP